MAVQNEGCIVIVGPTAVGKTKLGIELAKAVNGEVINGDALQVYKELNIGTAKVTKEETEGVPHHLLDFLDPSESYTVADFQKEARHWIHQLNGEGKPPIIVGGTGLYIKAVLYDYQFNDVKEDESYRELLLKRAKTEGPEALFQELVQVDPTAPERMHPNNLQRVIRSLEIYHKTGKPMADHLPDSQPELLFNPIVIGLTMERSLLYERINHRVEHMIQQGLIEEAKALFDRGIRDTQATKAIGYKELFGAFDGDYSLSEAVDLIKRNSRRFAKRQLTWFRHQMDVHWFDMTEAIPAPDKKINEILQFVAGKLKDWSN